VVAQWYNHKDFPDHPEFSEASWPIITWRGKWDYGHITEEQYYTTNPQPPLPSNEYQPTLERIRDDVIHYIAQQATDPFVKELVVALHWGYPEKVDSGVADVEKYIIKTFVRGWSDEWWAVEITSPIGVPDPVYNVYAHYDQDGVVTLIGIRWTGTWQSGTITQISYEDI
jgi:hypothetical protein